MDTFAVAAGRRAVIDDEWRRWIAENLLLDGNPDDLVATLLDRGIEPDEARREVTAAEGSPYVRAAQRLRNRLAKRDWVLDCERRMHQLLEARVPRVHRLPGDAFLRDYYTTGRPVIITGACNDWPALSRWTLEHFESAYGDAEVEVQSGRDADARYERDKLPHRTTMRFGEFVRRVRSAGRSNDLYMTASNDSHNRRALAGLWNDIGALAEYLDPGIPGGFLWFGPAGTITPFHHDLTHNLMAQVIGRKRVLIVPACEITSMHNDEHCFTPVDARDIDYQRFPGMRDARVLECVIGPGDLLFLPVGCWHFVEALDISVTLTFTNFRWDNDFTGRYPADTRF